MRLVTLTIALTLLITAGCGTPVAASDAAADVNAEASCAAADAGCAGEQKMECCGAKSGCAGEEAGTN